MLSRKENPYDLYGIDITLKQKKEVIKATREIHNAIKNHKWFRVEELAERYRKLGAWDTASMDMYYTEWKKKYHKSPPGYI